MVHAAVPRIVDREVTARVALDPQDVRKLLGAFPFTTHGGQKLTGRPKQENLTCAGVRDGEREVRV